MINFLGIGDKEMNPYCVLFLIILAIYLVFVVFMTADDAISSWSELDLEKIKIDSLDFEDFDLEMLGNQNNTPLASNF